MNDPYIRKAKLIKQIKKKRFVKQLIRFYNLFIGPIVLKPLFPETVIDKEYRN